MQLPPNSPDLQTGIDNLHQHYSKLERHVIDAVDELARSGFADMRWCSIARTHAEQAFMAMHRALRDYPEQDANNYGKTPEGHTHQMPPAFTPPVDPEGSKQIGEQRKLDWKDYSAGQTIDPPDKPEP